MDGFRGVRGIALAGMGVALLGGLSIAAYLISRDDGPTQPPPASQGGLVVETGRDDDIKLDERHPLRCFVGGKLVGELTLADCAHRNGVATGALDVGLDPSGALAAANGGDSRITPLPPGGSSPPPAQAPTAADPDAAALSGAGRVAGCWRFADGEWERLPDDESLGDCLRIIYAGQCSRAEAPFYGRWGDRTLRLLEGRIEISPDNRNFRVLTQRNPGCSNPG